MTLYTLLVYALLSSTAVGDSDRMARQFANTPTLDIASAGQISAPAQPYDAYTQMVPCDPDNCGKQPKGDQ